MDPEVNFDWGSGSPDPSLNADTFSVRWSGQLLIPETGNYTFSTLNSDGVRLYIDGVPVINDYVDHSTSWKDGTTISLTAGQRVELQMEYYDNTGSAVAKLKWTGPSFAGANGVFIAKEWLYDGAGITNRTPYAHAQTVAAVQNTAQTIILQGSGVISTPLTYTIVTQPTQGTLTGTVPNLTYTPTSNFTGSDSFTFLVNNGTGNSLPATVSIGISIPPASYTWLNATSGTWSTAGRWTASGVPATAGLPSYTLNFTPAGIYTATHNLTTGFKLNQLSLAGEVTLAGATKSLAFTANGPILPQFNQNSTSAVTINTPLSLAAMTTLGGIGGGPVTISSLISGAGGLTKDSPGTLQIDKVNNTYSGGTIISSGIVSLGLQANQALGTGPVTLNQGGVLTLEYIYAANSLILNGGTINSNNGFGNGFSSSVSLNANTTIFCDFDMALSGNISGAGGFTTTGVNTLVLSGTNSFTGPNNIMAGTLSCSQAAALGTGALGISSGAKVNLNYTGTRTIASVTLAGTPMPAGTYGSTASSATNKNDTYFSGTGTVTVGQANRPPTASAQSATTAEDTAKSITLSATDLDGNPLTYTIVAYPTYGSLSGTPPNVTYTPALNHNGAASFTFKANDGKVDSATATVSITVTAINDAPVATAQSLTTASNTAKSITLTGTDADNNALTYAIVTPPANGTLGGTPPNVTYTPSNNYNGPDSFTFKVNDGTVDSAPATVSITTLIGSPGNYIWDGTANSWTSAHWNAGAGLVSGPVGASNANAATINGGTVTFAASDTFGNATTMSSPVITINSGVTLASGGFFNTIWDLTLNGGTLLANGGVNDPFGAFALKGTVKIGGSAASNILASSGSFNTVSLGTSSGGTTTFNVSDVTASTAPDLTISNVLNNNSNVASSLIKTGAGTLALTGENTYSGGTTIGGGILQIGGGSTSGSLLNNTNITNNAVLVFNRSDARGFSGIISGGGAVTKQGAGTLTLSGNNTYTGGTVVNGGTLALNASHSAFNTTQLLGTLTINSGGTLSLTNSPFGWGGGLTTMNINGGTVINNGGLGAFGTVYHLTGGSISGTARIDLGFYNSVTGAINSKASGITSTITSSHFQGLMLRGDSGQTGYTFDVEQGTTSSAVDLQLPLITENAGPCSVVKTGAGTTTLSGANTYSGTTTVSMGTLVLVGGSQTSPITVSGGASLGFTLGSPTRSTSSFSLSAGTIKITGTPTLASYTLITSSTGITGTPTLNAPISGYTLMVDGVSLKLVQVAGYASWMAPFITGGLTGDTTPTGDPDNDSINNLLEYALNGNPAISDLSILPTLSVTTTDFEFTYTRVDFSLADTIQSFEYGSSLEGWTPVLIPAGPGVSTVGIATVTIIDTGATDSVKVSIPRSTNAGGKLFGRLKVVK